MGVECGERLVHQQYLRFVGEHARDLDALLHAAGQLGWMLVLLAGEPDQLEVLPGLPVALAACDAAHAQAEFDIAERGEPRIKRIVALEDDAAIGARPADRRTVDPDAARGRP